MTRFKHSIHVYLFIYSLFLLSIKIRLGEIAFKVAIRNGRNRLAHFRPSNAAQLRGLDIERGSRWLVHCSAGRVEAPLFLRLC